MNLNLIFH